MSRVKPFITQRANAPPLMHDTNHDKSPAYFTEEGYLIDTPRVTRVGVFDYPDKPADIRRQLRLPEEVFSPESLASYKGKPIIITHDGGEITSDNVGEEAVGTILSEGREAGEYVEADTVIHEPDRIKGMRELSLGYSLDLDKTPGVWNGQPYDCIQRNIRINHLAVVGSARAGDKSRLNIDGHEKHTEGDATMAKQKNGDSAVGDLVEAIEAVGAEIPEEVAADTDNGEENPLDIALKATAAEEGEAPEENKDDEPENLEAAIELIRSLRAELEALKGGQHDDENCEDEDCEGKTMNADAVDRIVNEKLLLIRLGERLGIVGIQGMTLRAAKQEIVRKGNPSMNCDGLDDRSLNLAVAMTAKNMTKSTDRQRGSIHNRDAACIGVSTAQAAREKMIKEMNGGND